MASLQSPDWVSHPKLLTLCFLLRHEILRSFLSLLRTEFDDGLGTDFVPDGIVLVLADDIGHASSELVKVDPVVLRVPNLAAVRLRLGVSSQGRRIFEPPQATGALELRNVVRTGLEMADQRGCGTEVLRARSMGALELASVRVVVLHDVEVGVLRVVNILDLRGSLGTSQTLCLWSTWGRKVRRSNRALLSGVSLGRASLGRHSVGLLNRREIFGSEERRVCHLRLGDVAHSRLLNTRMKPRKIVAELGTAPLLELMSESELLGSISVHVRTADLRALVVLQVLHESS